MLAGPIQHFRAAILDGWRNCVSADLCGWKGFRGGPHLDWRASSRPSLLGRLRRYFLVWLCLIVGYNLTSGFVLLSLLGGGVTLSVIKFCTHISGLHVGYLLLSRVGGLSRRRSRRFGEVYDGRTRFMSAEHSVALRDAVGSAKFVLLGMSDLLLRKVP